MKYTRIANGLVVEIFDALPVFHPEVMATIVEAPDDVQRGMTYANGVFSIYTPPLPTKQERIAAIEAAINPRWLRNAPLGDTFAIQKLQEIEAQIAAIRVEPA